MGANRMYIFKILAGAYLLYLCYKMINDAAFEMTFLKIGFLVLFAVVGVVLIILGIKQSMVKSENVDDTDEDEEDEEDEEDAPAQSVTLEAGESVQIEGPSEEIIDVEDEEEEDD